MNNYILIGLIILTTACIYLFYLYYNKYNEYHDIHNEVNKLKQLNTELNEKLIDISLTKRNIEKHNAQFTEEEENELEEDLKPKIEEVENIEELDNLNDLDDLDNLDNLDDEIENISNIDKVEDMDNLEIKEDIVKQENNVESTKKEEKTLSEKDMEILNNLDNMNFKELKIVAKNIGIKIKGSKEELTTKIREHFSK